MFTNESFTDFWRPQDCGESRSFFDHLCASAARSELHPIERVDRTLKDHLRGLLACFPYTITNAVAPGANSKIQAISNQPATSPSSPFTAFASSFTAKGSK